MTDSHDKLLLGRHGEAVQVWKGTERRKFVRFPVSLSIKYSDGLYSAGNDFIMNISKGGVFIRTGWLRPVGSSLSIQIYIPPDGKNLGEFNGKVVRVSEGYQPGYPRGMHIEFTDCTAEVKKSLSDFLDGKQHLLDEKF